MRLELLQEVLAAGKKHGVTERDTFRQTIEWR